MNWRFWPCSHAQGCGDWRDGQYPGEYTYNDSVRDGSWGIHNHLQSSVFTMELEDDGIPRLFNDIDCLKGVQLDRGPSDDDHGSCV